MTSDKDKEKASEFIGCIVFVMLIALATSAVCVAVVAVRWAF